MNGSFAWICRFLSRICIQDEEYRERVRKEEEAASEERSRTKKIREGSGAGGNKAAGGESGRGAGLGAQSSSHSEKGKDAGGTDNGDRKGGEDGNGAPSQEAVRRLQRRAKHLQGLAAKKDTNVSRSTVCVINSPNQIMQRSKFALLGARGDYSGSLLWSLLWSPRSYRLQ